MNDADRPKRRRYLRERWREIIFEADTPAGKAFDVLLLVFIVSSVAVVMFESMDEFRAEHGALLRSLEWFFTITFTIEYAARLVTAPQPIRYARSFFGVVDLVSILPTYLALLLTGAQYLIVIRALRLLRMFRVLKIVRYVGEAEGLLLGLRAARPKIVIFLLGVVSLMIIMGTIMYLVEGPGEPFSSIPISIYWAIVTITTVGFGDITPVTPLGKFLASGMMIIGYAIIAVPTGIVTAEIYGAAQLRSDGSAEPTRCPSCDAVGHHADAQFCFRCGAKLTTAARSDQITS